MNYFEWSREYSAEADRLEKVIKELYSRRSKLDLSERNELDRKLAEYRNIRYDCINTAGLLMDRHRGVA